MPWGCRRPGWRASGRCWNRTSPRGGCRGGRGHRPAGQAHLLPGVRLPGPGRRRAHAEGRAVFHRLHDQAADRRGYADPPGGRQAAPGRAGFPLPALAGQDARGRRPPPARPAATATVAPRTPISIQDLMRHTAGMAYAWEGKTPAVQAVARLGGRLRPRVRRSRVPGQARDPAAAASSLLGLGVQRVQRRARLAGRGGGQAAAGAVPGQPAVPATGHGGHRLRGPGRQGQTLRARPAQRSRDRPARDDDGFHPAAPLRLRRGLRGVHRGRLPAVRPDAAGPGPPGPDPGAGPQVGRADDQRPPGQRDPERRGRE